MLIDTHCHLDAAEFDADRDVVHALAQAAGVERIVIPAVAVDGFPKVKSTVGRYPGCVAAYGIHPLYVMQAQESDLAVLRDWLGGDEVDQEVRWLVVRRLASLGDDSFIEAEAERDRSVAGGFALLRAADEIEYRQ